MQSPGPISDDPPHKGVLREETVILRWILGYGPTTQLSGAPWPRVPPTISPPRSNSNIRRVGFVSIDIDELKEDERGIQSFHLGVSTVEAQGLQNLLFSQPGSEVNLASHVIKSRHYVVADPRYCGKKRNKFLFGKRNQIGLMDVEKKLKNSLHVPNSILIFHGGKRELAVLKQLNIMLDPLFTIDTVKAAQHPLELFYRYSLRKLLREFGIPYALLHFAGNDAHFVLRALLMIAVRDAERELDRMPDWVSVFRAVAQAPRPPTLDEKAMIAKRERLEREEREREKEKGKESHGPGVKDSEPDGPRVTEEYRLNQCVIIFLIENQDHFLIGMQGTAADEKTKKEVESGTPSAPLTPNPNRRSSLGRSASNASAGANSVRRDGKVRRNRSVSSRNSRNEGSSTPNSPALTATPTTGGLARSNTLPSKRSPALTGGRFQRQHDGSSPRSPAHLEPLTQMNAAEGIDQSPQSTRSSDLAASGHLTPTKAPATGRSQERLLEVPQESPTPSKERNLPSLFQRAPAENNDRRQPNKLKKKRIPGSLNPSAQSSNASLQYGQQNAASPGYELPNPLDHPHQDPDPQALQPQPQPPPPIQEERHREHQEQQHDQLHRQHLHDTQLTPPASLVPQKSEVSSEHTPRASQASSNQNLHPDNTLKSKKSPPTSLHSSFNEGSDLDQVLDEQSINTIDQAEKEKKRRWRLSRSKNPDNGASTPSGVTSPRMVLGSNDNADVSNLSISSSSHRPRKSESSDRPMVLGGDAHGSFDSSRDRDESKGPIGWIRNKYREAKESAEQLRNKSPPADRSSLSATSFLPRGKSLDMKRDAPKDAERQAANPPVPQGSISTPAAAPAIASTVAAPLGPTFAPAPSTVPAPQPATVAIVNQPPPHHQEPPPPQPLQTEQQQHPTPVSASTSSAGPLSPPAPVLPPVVAPQLAQQQEQEQLQPEQKQAQTQEAKPEQKPVQQPEQSPVSPPVQSEQPLQAQPSEVPHQQPQPEPSKHEQ